MAAVAADLQISLRSYTSHNNRKQRQEGEEDRGGTKRHLQFCAKCEADRR